MQYVHAKYVGQMSHNLKIHFQEYIRYIRTNNPQLVFAQHILQNQHEYGQMNSIITLLKPPSSPSMLIPYEQYYIQTLQSNNETHYTQQNTTITTHKRSQLLILIETRYQLQPSDKELHIEHIPLRTIILH